MKCVTNLNSKLVVRSRKRNFIDTQPTILFMVEEFKSCVQDVKIWSYISF